MPAPSPKPGTICARALDEVETVTGVHFGQAFHALGDAGIYRYDSEPPSRAIVAFRQLTQDPARTVAFAHAVQQALFRDGHGLNEIATYVPLLAFLAWMRPSSGTAGPRPKPRRLPGRSLPPWVALGCRASPRW